MRRGMLIARGTLMAACMAMTMSGVSAFAPTTGAIDAYQGGRDCARGIFTEPVGGLGTSGRHGRPPSFWRG